MDMMKKAGIIALIAIFGAAIYFVANNKMSKSDNVEVQHHHHHTDTTNRAAGESCYNGDNCASGNCDNHECK